MKKHKNVHRFQTNCVNTCDKCGQWEMKWNKIARYYSTDSGSINDRLSWTLDVTRFERQITFAMQHCVKRMKDGTIIFQFPARNFSDNIDSVLNADFTSGLEGTKEPQTVTRKRNVPLHRKHWRTTDIRAFDTGSSWLCVRVFSLAQNWASVGCVSVKWVRGIADFAPCFIPDAHRLLFSCTFVSPVHRRSGKLSSLSVSIFQSHRVMSASRRQAVVALTGRSCQDSWEYRWRKYSWYMYLSLSRYLPSVLAVDINRWARRRRVRVARLWLHMYVHLTVGEQYICARIREYTHNLRRAATLIHDNRVDVYSRVDGSRGMYTICYTYASEWV